MSPTKVNPFTITGATAWPLPRQQQHREGGTEGTESTEGTEQLQEEEIQQLARLLGRLLDQAEAEPELYEALPWLRKVSLWELLLKRWADARFPYVRRSSYVPRVPRSAQLSQPSHTCSSSDPTDPSESSDLLDLWDLPETPNKTTRAVADTAMPQTAATLLTFFSGVTQPMEEMVEALYLSPLLRDTCTVWEILRRMAQTAGVKPLSREVVIALCANLTRSRLITPSQCRPQPHPAIWTITWRRISIRLQWPMHWFRQQPLQQPIQQPMHRDHDTGDTGDTDAAGNSLLVVVREEITHKAGVGLQQTGKVLALRCLPDPIHLSDTDTESAVDIDIDADLDSGSRETAECLQTAKTLALYDALVFSRSRDGEFNGPICPPTLLRMQMPVPEAIREAASVWGIQLEQLEQIEEAGSPPEREATDWVGEQEEEWEKWEKELVGRVLDPLRYMRILDRGLERTYGYAPFLAKQRVMHCQGWLWSMHPDHDPLLNYMGLQELLPSYPAVVGDDGSIEWPGGGQGWHYRDYEADVLRYFQRAHVRVRRSPLNEAVIVVYWRGSVLCYGVAAELRHEDGTCRSYWFPHPRLGQ